ncbi:MAG: UDP-N-acetylmuramate--L-alanine ligase [Holosporales bacterium]|jgi:UDP-N-acetylmuramate--alanine ligase|nr:UDP-N-acetylmuramate--L-alanine ligase [Holosporales bacterium]
MFDIRDGSRVIHFIGLGGIGVSGLAEILHSIGYSVQGSDICRSQNIERLERIGITAFVGHDKEHVNNAGIVVYSSAIRQDNPELIRAKELKIPCLTRAEMLSQIVRLKKSVVVAGSHGKTTVTSMCAAVLEMASLSPTVINGGIINSYKTNAKLGAGDWAVVESDESDGSFVTLFPTIGIVTNIDREHINHYGSFDNLKLAFKSFLNNLPFYGAGIVCLDDAHVREVIDDITDRNIVTYSIAGDSMFRAINIKKTAIGSTFDVKIHDSFLENISIPLLGDHNILNALSAIAVATELKVDLDLVKSTLASFSGVSRRFTLLGDIRGISFVDDYAHHPTEIRTLIRAAQQKTDGKIVIVCQPHRFTRLNILFKEFCECFDGASLVIITSVYRADDAEEDPDIPSKNLYDALRKAGKDAIFAADEADVAASISDLINNNVLNDGDIILFAGAGSISRWAYNIYEELSNS